MQMRYDGICDVEEIEMGSGKLQSCPSKPLVVSYALHGMRPSKPNTMDE